ncbi:putative transporter AQR1 [Pichia kudriavzevii]|uniref:Putative transporter AQR1 n=1 Tax=Pichia kudriavzevii TaxID=4909 RepID=A0A1V2LIL1_PICKU|nr:putative transporter AQR1 [Pichia kudriavzevii]
MKVWTSLPFVRDPMQGITSAENGKCGLGRECELEQDGDCNYDYDYDDEDTKETKQADNNGDLVRESLKNQPGDNWELEKYRSIDEDDHTILTHRERVVMALTLSLIGLCSAMSMPIYWTALTELEREFHTTESKINYTVTAYLCFQAVAPVFVSSFSDIWGRRPVILVCITAGLCTNVGLAVSRTYWLIVFLRCVLASSLAPLVSITAASVGDFTTRRNRGSLTGLTTGFTLIGQGIAPFLGAVMDTAWGWPAIFWFSAAFNGTILLLSFVLVPETHRGYVGNLGIKPKSFIHYSPYLLYLGSRLEPYDENKVAKRDHKYQPWKPLMLSYKPDILSILLPCSILFALWTISQTTLSVHFSKVYHMRVIIIGVCFFAPGMASIFGTVISGRVLDYLYRKRKAVYDATYKDLAPQDRPPFNIVKVRLLTIPFAGLFAAMASIVFGWCMDKHTNIAPILIMSFLITFFVMFPLNTAVTVLIDMYPQIAGGATALNNLFRCGMSAIFVSCLNMMEDKMTVGGTYTFMAAISLLFLTVVLRLIIGNEDTITKPKNLSED